MDQLVKIGSGDRLAAKADHKGAVPMGVEVRPDLPKPVDEGFVLKKRASVGHLSDKKTDRSRMEAVGSIQQLCSKQKAPRTRISNRH